MAAWVLQVVACFKGRGLVAGGINQASREVEGRLWLYDNGDLGFVWLDDIQCAPAHILCVCVCMLVGMHGWLQTSAVQRRMHAH